MYYILHTFYADCKIWIKTKCIDLRFHAMYHWTPGIVAKYNDVVNRITLSMLPYEHYIAHLPLRLYKRIYN
jgi:hypothetical protein